MKHQIQEYIRKGKILIYPTDTIYGIGADATNSESVRGIRKLKKSNKPFSVIASKIWIRKNCVISKEVNKYLKKLPGPYTLILKLKNKKAVSKETKLGADKIGIRIPKHKFTSEILKAKKPFVSTSVNETGKSFATSVKNLPKKFKSSIIIDVGKLKGTPSKIYDLTTSKKARRIR